MISRETCYKCMVDVGLEPIGVLAIIFMVMALTGIISERLSVSPILFFIGFGMIFGPNGLKIIDHSRELDLLRQMGLVLLLFIAGLDFDFDSVQKKLKNAIIIATPPGIVGFGLTFLIYYTYGWFNMVETLILGLILTTTSISLSVSVLREKLNSDSDVYQTMILAIIMSNVVMILVAGLITRSIQAAKFSFMAIFGNFLLVVGFLLIVIYLSRNVHHYWMNKLTNADELEDDQERMRINNQRMQYALGILGLILSIAFLIDIDVAIAAFVGGIYVNQTTRMKQKDIAKMKTLGYGLLIPIFFFTMGMHIDISHFSNLQTVFITSVILFLSFIGQVTLTALSSMLAQFSMEESINLGIGLSACSLSGGFAVLAIGYDSGQITSSGYTIFAAVISISVLMTIFGLEIYTQFSFMAEDEIEQESSMGLKP